jgi:6-pyruvoyltetrahydropterin/6-carboxytetrahydropterin synthase
MPLSLTRTVRFFALHHFWRPDWSAERNREVFGALADERGHGHDYECAVTVAGELDPLGAVIDLAVLDRVLAEEVLGPFEGRHLTRDVPAFADGRPLATCEAMAAYLYPRIAARLPEGVQLERVRVAEDASLYADCTGPR